MQDTLIVRERLVEFVQAARESDDGYTVRDLQEMVELELMMETGGLLNWVKRKMTGIDDDALEEVQAGMDEIATEEDRQKALREIEELLKECGEIAGRSNARHAGTVAVGAGALKLSGLLNKNRALGKAAVGFVSNIGKSVSNIFRSTETKKAMSAVSGSLIFGAIAAYGAVKVAQGLARIYVTNDGTMDDYIAALRAARKEIESKKLGKDAE
jgi:hypothetical protein